MEKEGMEVEVPGCLLAADNVRDTGLNGSGLSQLYLQTFVCENNIHHQQAIFFSAGADAYVPARGLQKIVFLLRWRGCCGCLISSLWVGERVILRRGEKIMILV